MPFFVRSRNNGKTFYLHIKHGRLPKPVYHTFDVQEDAPRSRSARHSGARSRRNSLGQFRCDHLAEAVVHLVERQCESAERGLIVGPDRRVGPGNVVVGSVIGLILRFRHSRLRLGYRSEQPIDHTLKK